MSRAMSPSTTRRSKAQASICLRAEHRLKHVRAKEWPNNRTRRRNVLPQAWRRAAQEATERPSIQVIFCAKGHAPTSWQLRRRTNNPTKLRWRSLAFAWRAQPSCVWRRRRSDQVRDRREATMIRGKHKHTEVICNEAAAERVRCTVGWSQNSYNPGMHVRIQPQWRAALATTNLLRMASSCNTYAESTVACRMVLRLHVARLSPMNKGASVNPRVNRSCPHVRPGARAKLDAEVNSVVGHCESSREFRQRRPSGPDARRRSAPKRVATVHPPVWV